MAWNTIRKATETDVTRLNEAAERFCNRHNIHFEEGAALTAVEDATVLDYRASDHFLYRARELRPLWKRVMRRALNSPDADGIAYGYVGRSAN